MSKFRPLKCEEWREGFTRTECFRVGVVRDRKRHEITLQADIDAAADPSAARAAMRSLALERMVEWLWGEEPCARGKIGRIEWARGMRANLAEAARLYPGPWPAPKRRRPSR